MLTTPKMVPLLVWYPILSVCIESYVRVGSN